VGVDVCVHGVFVCVCAFECVYIGAVWCGCVWVGVDCVDACGDACASVCGGGWGCMLCVFVRMCVRVSMYSGGTFEPPTKAPVPLRTWSQGTSRSCCSAPRQWPSTTSAYRGWPWSLWKLSVARRPSQAAGPESRFRCVTRCTHALFTRNTLSQKYRRFVMSMSRKYLNLSKPTAMMKLPSLLAAATVTSYFLLLLSNCRVTVG